MLIQEFELKGEWWIPSNPNKKLKGILKSEQYDNPKLNVNGYFWHNTEALISPIIILGQLEDKRIVTLYKVSVIRLKTDDLGHTPPSSSFEVDFIFLGIHFDKLDNIKFDSIDIRYSEIDNWISFDDFDKYSSKNQSHIVSADTHEGFIINLVHEYNPISRSKIYVQIKNSNKDKKYFDEHFRIKNIMQDFLSFAVARPIRTISVTGYISTNDVHISKTDMRNAPVEIYHTEFSDPFIVRKKYHRGLFSFKQIADNFEIIIRKWIEVENRLREVIALYISVVDSPSMYLQLQFQLIIYALEVYHRRTTINQETTIEEHNKKISAILESCPAEYRDWLAEELKYSYEPNLRHRLKELISKYEQIFPLFIEGKKRTFVNKVVNTRNYLTHYDPNLKDMAITDMNELYEVIHKLTGLFEVCLLSEIASIEGVKKMYEDEN